MINNILICYFYCKTTVLALVWLVLRSACLPSSEQALGCIPPAGQVWLWGLEGTRRGSCSQTRSPSLTQLLLTLMPELKCRHIFRGSQGCSSPLAGTTSSPLTILCSLGSGHVGSITRHTVSRKEGWRDGENQYQKMLMLTHAFRCCILFMLQPTAHLTKHTLSSTSFWFQISDHLAHTGLNSKGT